MLSYRVHVQTKRAACMEWCATFIISVQCVLTFCSARNDPERSTTANIVDFSDGTSIEVTFQRHSTVILVKDHLSPGRAQCLAISTSERHMTGAALPLRTAVSNGHAPQRSQPPIRVVGNMLLTTTTRALRSSRPRSFILFRKRNQAPLDLMKPLPLSLAT
jgi:hypothetical protein